MALGIEPRMEALQASALPLGDATGRYYALMDEIGQNESDTVSTNSWFRGWALQVLVEVNNPFLRDVKRLHSLQEEGR